MRSPARPLACASVLFGLLAPALVWGGIVLDQNFDPGPQGNLTSLIYNNADLSTGHGDFATVAQTFTVSQAGVLPEFDVKLAYNNGGSNQIAVEPLTLRLLATSDGRPRSDAGAVLATAQIPSVSVPMTESLAAAPNDARFVPVVLSDSPPLSVTAGEVLAIALSVDSPVPNEGVYTWIGTNSSHYPYAGGKDFAKQRPFEQPDLSWLTDGPWVALSDASLYDALGFRTYVSVPEPAAALPTILAPLLMLRRRSSDQDN